MLNQRVFVGRVDWIGIASEKRGSIQTPERVELVAGQGIRGEHHFGKRPLRQVTLIQREHIAVVSALLQKESLPPSLFRRNIMVSGINLAALVGRTFTLGQAVLEGTNECPPCKRMEELLGEGGYEAMVAHGGITASVVNSGDVSLSDSIQANT